MWQRLLRTMVVQYFHKLASRTCSAFGSVRRHRSSRIVCLCHRFHGSIVQIHNWEQRTSSPPKKLSIVRWHNELSRDEYSSWGFWGLLIILYETHPAWVIRPFKLTRSERAVPDDRWEDTAQNATAWNPIFKLERFPSVNISMTGLGTVCDSK